MEEALHSGSTNHHDPHGGHHHDILSLVPDNNVTHVASQSGSWSNPHTWSTGVVPSHGAKIVIPESIHVVYDNPTEVPYISMRIDGKLSFSTTAPTNLLIDTIVVAHGGTFELGTIDSPMTQTTTITFYKSGELYDPTSVATGLIGLPGANITVHGEETTGRTLLDGSHFAGDNFISFQDGVPTGWDVGDIIVIPGTTPQSTADNIFGDEMLIVTDISSEGFYFSRALNGGDSLEHDHEIPDGFGLSIHAINLSRNIVFRSEFDDATPTSNRAHIMIMDHNTNIKNAAFIGLGRTDKEKLIDPLPSSQTINGHEIAIDGSGTNIPGRYPLHIHRALDHGDDGAAALLSGNSIWGSPGWGLVLHGARGYVDGNVVYDTVGAGIVAEDGDEVGYFRGNTVVGVKSGTTGADFPENIVRLQTKEGLPLDFGFHGNGFWLDTPYAVREFSDNVVASTAHAGVFIYGQNDGEITRYINAQSAPSELQKYSNEGKIDPFSVPAGTIANNTVYNAEYGFFLAGLHRDDNLSGGTFSPSPYGGGMPLEHSDPTTITNALIWGIRSSGIFTAYAQGFSFNDIVIVGDPEKPNASKDARGPDAGILIHKMAHNITIDNVRVEGFHSGLTIGGGGTQGYNDVDPLDTFVFSNMTLRNNIYNFFPAAGRTGSDPQKHPEMMTYPPFNPFAVLTGENTFESMGPNLAPVAQFVATPIAPDRFLFDARGSYDPDYLQDPQIAGRSTIANSIAFFRWDIDNDGTIDGFGREFVAQFSDKRPSYDVTLYVTDAQGATSAKSLTVLHAPGSSRDLVLNGTFDDPYGVGRNFSSVGTARRLEGTGEIPAWYARFDSKQKMQTWQEKDGVARIQGQRTAAQTLDQLVIDNGEHRGTDILTFDFLNIEGDGAKHSVSVEVWGINGAPIVSPWFEPEPIYLLEAFHKHKIFEATLPKNSTAEWQQIRALVEFGDGYEYIFIRFKGEQVGAANGDIVAVDNIRLGGTSFPGNTAVIVPSPDGAGEPIEETKTDLSALAYGVDVTHSLGEIVVDRIAMAGGAALTLTGGSITVSSADGLANGGTVVSEGGSFLFNGHSSGSKLTFDGTGGLLANSGKVTGRIDVVADSGEVVLAGSGGLFRLNAGSRLSVEGSDVLVGFDGGIGKSIFNVAGGELHFVFDAEGLATIKPFSSSVDGDGRSGVSVEARFFNGTIVADLSAMDTSLPSRHVLLSVDQLVGGLDKFDVRIIGAPEEREVTLNFDQKVDQLFLDII